VDVGPGPTKRPVCTSCHDTGCLNCYCYGHPCANCQYECIEPDLTYPVKMMTREHFELFRCRCDNDTICVNCMRFLFQQSTHTNSDESKQEEDDE
jgi:hypothetical protein